MRILHVTPTYVPAWRHGGPIWAVHGLARALAARGHRVEVFTTNVHGEDTLDVPLERPVDVDGVAVTYFPVAMPRRLYRSPAMKAALQDRVPEQDVVHVHSIFLWPTSAAARAAEAAGVPYFVSPRGMLVADLVRRKGTLRKRAWLRLVERRTLARARGLVVTSDVEALEARRFGLPLAPLFEVPNGIDLAPFAAAPEGPLARAVAAALTRQPLVLFLGRLSWKKGLELLVPAMAGAPRATLAIAGNDQERLTPELLRLAAAHGVGERVLFLGPVGPRDKLALLRSATLLALPSLSENFANVVLEAMAAGCPALVTPEVGLASVVAEAGAGLVAPRASFAQALGELLGDPARIEAMRLGGPRVVAERFTWERVAAAMEALYAGSAP